MKMLMKNSPEAKRFALVRALFERALEHARDLGVVVKVKHTRGAVPFVTGRLWLETEKQP